MEITVEWGLIESKKSATLNDLLHIEGSDEKARGVVQIKDLALGARLAAELETREEWKAQPAQMEIPRGDLVAEVAKMIARAG